MILLDLARLCNILRIVIFEAEFELIIAQWIAADFRNLNGSSRMDFKLPEPINNFNEI